MRFHLPTVQPDGRTVFGKAVFESRVPIDPHSSEIDTGTTLFTEQESRHFRLAAWKGSPAERDAAAILEQRENGLARIVEILGVVYSGRIRLWFLPDEETKVRVTEHHGMGWAFGNHVIEVYNPPHTLDPYHEIVHIVAGQLGAAAPMFEEGLAVYVSESLGADALQHLASPGKTCDQVVREHQAARDLFRLDDLLALQDIGNAESRAAVSYPQSCSVVKFLVERYGKAKLRAALGEVGPGDHAAFKRIYGRSIESLEREWRANLDVRRSR